MRRITSYLKWILTIGGLIVFLVSVDRRVNFLEFTGMLFAFYIASVILTTLLRGILKSGPVKKSVIRSLAAAHVLTQNILLMSIGTLYNADDYDEVPSDLNWEFVEEKETEDGMMIRKYNIRGTNTLVVVRSPGDSDTDENDE